MVNLSEAKHAHNALPEAELAADTSLARSRKDKLRASRGFVLAARDLLYREDVRGKKSFDFRWDSPFRMVSVRPGLKFELRKEHGRQLDKAISGNRLKLYHILETTLIAGRSVTKK